jgi:CRISPR-associated endonuclease/helicase Cas3
LRNLGEPLAFVVAGHHCGLSDQARLSNRLRLKRDRLDRARNAGASSSCLATETATRPDWLEGAERRTKTRLELWIRLLFSCLCDADFLDTEAFYEADRARARECPVSLSQLRDALRVHLDELERAAAQRGVNEVHRVRQEVRAACVAAASRPRGVFTLTVPTGGGKTLASMVFALEHALHHEMHRVVVAIPYTSIIEQSARAYWEAFGELLAHAVVEHHSALDPLRETAFNRIASENWDAPVIVTTNVQLFESLFANKPSRCRKLHNLARAVIVLDEAQTLPPKLLRPSVDVLRDLVDLFGASVVICTATTPALSRCEHLPEGFDPVAEILPEPKAAFERLRRVRVRWPETEQPVEWDALAAEIAKEADVLAVVHRRADARDLCKAMDGALGDERPVHLSALMCPEHRSRVIGEIKSRKARGEPVRVVSTQLVEAGVDLDFAVVYRALGGIDALAQAAGRCNREGRMAGLGELRVFRAKTRPPRGVLQAALAVTETMLRAEPGLELFDPETYRRFFGHLYHSQNLDRAEVQELRAELDYPGVAAAYELVEDGCTAPVAVRYGDAPRALCDLEHAGPSRDRLRALQRYTVQVPRRVREGWLASGAAREVAGTVVALHDAFAGAYDERFGLMIAAVGVADPEQLVI